MVWFCSSALFQGCEAFDRQKVNFRVSISQVKYKEILMVWIVFWKHQGEFWIFVLTEEIWSIGVQRE